MENQEMVASWIRGAVPLATSTFHAAAVATCQATDNLRLPLHHKDYRTDVIVQTDTFAADDIVVARMRSRATLIALRYRDEGGLLLWSTARAELRQALEKHGWEVFKTYKADIHMRPPTKYCRQCPNLLRCTMEGVFQ